MFIADSGDNVVREVTPAGVICRIAGTGIAGLATRARSASRPTQLRSTTPRTWPSTPPGDAFIADTYNNRVVKVTPQGQVIAVAGDGVAGYSGDGRLAAFAELNSPPASPSTRRGTCTSPTRPTTSSAGSTPRPGSSPPSPATTPPTRPATASAASPATAAPPPAPSSTTPRASPSTAPATCSSPTPSTTPSARSPRPASSPPW